MTKQHIGWTEHVHTQTIEFKKPAAISLPIAKPQATETMRRKYQALVDGGAKAEIHWIAGNRFVLSCNGKMSIVDEFMLFVEPFSQERADQILSEAA